MAHRACANASVINEIGRSLGFAWVQGTVCVFVERGHSDMLSDIRIVLIETSHPGNIGATARAMKNMCLEHLYLVSPQRFPDADATARASGADDVLARAQICDSLDEAIQDCGLVVGASARQRSLAWPEFDPRECASRVLAESAGTSVAIVFGRERAGLTNEELERCHYLVHIPSNPNYSSLNIGAAVQVITYELLMAAKGGAAPGERAEEWVPASAQDMARFYAHLERVLIEIDFLDPANPKHLMRRLKRLCNRSRPDDTELNVLRGILTAVERSRQRN
jgi:tRNA (cytidine32/uridine32-2'-O)-methyltransferase